MDGSSVSPLPCEAPLAMMESEKTPPRSPSQHDMPPPPDENVLLSGATVSHNASATLKKSPNKIRAFHSRREEQLRCGFSYSFSRTIVIVDGKTASRDHAVVRTSNGPTAPIWV
uniref:FHA domain-containing protein n=1 Tax=Anopheles culicifacies TaxID=139723 RepID=A0A182MQ13_9DIPT